MTALIMGIVNVTPDSFSDGGRYSDHDEAIAHGLRIHAQGAALLDVGGESTRPGAVRVDPRVEQQRVLPVIEALAHAGAAVSVDTMNASTALAAVEAGATIINDVSGGLADPEMLSAIASTRAEVALGHWRGPSDQMYARAEYVDTVSEVIAELEARIEAAVAAGIARERIIIDPGIGFGKKGEQNWAVLRALPRLVALGPRVLVGTSRKRFLAELLESGDSQGAASEPRRDLATAVTSVLAAEAGAWAVRVHEVSATADALSVAESWHGRRPIERESRN